MKNRILFISLFALSFLVSGPLFAQKEKKNKNKGVGSKGAKVVHIRVARAFL